MGRRRILAGQDVRILHWWQTPGHMRKTGRHFYQLHLVPGQCHQITMQKIHNQMWTPEIQNSRIINHRNTDMQSFNESSLSNITLQLNPAPKCSHQITERSDVDYQNIQKMNNQSIVNQRKFVSNDYVKTLIFKESTDNTFYNKDYSIALCRSCKKESNNSDYKWHHCSNDIQNFFVSGHSHFH